MSDDAERPFMARARQLPVILRPRVWRRWWSTEPFTTKGILVALLALTGSGIFALLLGDGGLGMVFLALPIIALGLLVSIVAASVLLARLRWLFRRTGITARWQRVRDRVLGIAGVIFWIAVVGGGIAVWWPYLAYLFHPVKGWYALENNVPLSRVKFEEKPHDCDFMTAPLGDKNCHYDAKAVVLQATESPNGKRLVVVTYEKVQD